MLQLHHSPRIFATHNHARGHSHYDCNAKEVTSSSFLCHIIHAQYLLIIQQTENAIIS